MYEFLINIFLNSIFILFTIINFKISKLINKFKKLEKQILITNFTVSILCYILYIYFIISLNTVYYVVIIIACLLSHNIYTFLRRISNEN